MPIARPRRRRVPALTAVAAFAVLAASAAAAPTPIPANGLRIDQDPARGIPAAGNAGASDVAAGSTTAGARINPWATFEKAVGGHSQVFVRSYGPAGWVTEGRPASLNLNTGVDAEAPSIDFAGPDRTVPWVSWYEPSTALGGANQIIASHYDEPTERWIPAGQDRGGSVPSLNINTGRSAENPAVAGGATTAGAAPVPWVAWQENDGPSGGRDQIFVSRGVKTTDATCAAGTIPAGGAVIGGFCWQEVGVPRMTPDAVRPSGAATDATLNIDPSRIGEAADIAFTGPNDTVPWVVWYEEGASGLGLRGNELVFAAKGVADPAALGGFTWKVEGARTAGLGAFPLDRSGTNGIGRCGESTTTEDQCSINIDPNADAADPRVAAGTLTPGQATVPWVAWVESTAGGRHGVFVSRLVGGDHFEAMNGGRAVSPAGQDALAPDITFAKNTPVVTWRAAVGGHTRAFTGHFTADGTFVNDTPKGIQRSRTGVGPTRVPVTSDCTADPTSGDGAACRGGVPGTAFLLFTDGPGGSRGLFGEALGAGANARPAPSIVRWPLLRAGTRTQRVVVKADEPGVLTVTLRQGARRAVTVVDVPTAGRVTVTLRGLRAFRPSPLTLKVALRDELGATGTVTRRAVVVS